MDPFTGRVLSLSGGFSFKQSEFNRATQAKRQPGSAFKPFVYALALENNFTPTSLVLDAPLVLDQGDDLKMWKPENYGKKFYGPSTLRVGLEKSRNLMTVRIAQGLGLEKIVNFSKFVPPDKWIPKLLLCGTLKFVCFSGDSHDFEVREKFFMHFSMTTSELGWLLEIIPLLRKKFHGPTTSRTLSMFVKVKNY